jgi:NAD(P)-dependent dehydrogenase (short-subunit alcohol dehydrogenase family)
MDLKLAQKVAIVTGGASGIGRSVAKLLVAEGVKVVIADLQEEKGKEVVFDIKSGGGEAAFIRVNTSSHDDVKRLVETTLSDYGQLDALFNIAGPGAVGGQLDTDEEEFNKQINGHLRGVFQCTQAVLPHMMERKSGKIVNIGSFAAFGALDSIPAYCAAFGGIVSYTKNVGRFAAAYNININSVSPGNILTPMTINWLSEAGNMENLTKQIPIGRVGAPEDIASVCVFLASDLARHIVATNINVSGGQLIY